MKISEFMSTRLVTVEPDDTLEVMQEIFANTRFHHLLVLDKGRLAGVVSDRDVLRNLSPYLGSTSEHYRDLATAKRRTHQIMSRNPLTLTGNQTLAEVITLFREHPVSCIPVLDETGELAGIVTWRDILGFVSV